MNVRRRYGLVAALAALLTSATASADQDAHAGASGAPSPIAYQVPDVQLVRDDGRTVRLPEDLDGRRSVVLSFIFTACTSICPVTSATFAQLQRRLGSQSSRVQLVLISIDPEQDTPARLAAYAKKVGAGPGWRFYTGTAAASIAVQRAFDAFEGDKMRHAPDTYVRKAGSRSWVRLRGFATADELLAECGLTLPAT